ncbi:atypical chemokine receptor 4 [Denticeps clupeoides]|uniref:G-protein coupled receptors family 1 profile domain-containing protein n=1 Tax=Denticeps clupeoides TaxID=299321 RepID=A0AAY4B1P8_9TELE|nr:atypical chemokine receptor 4-like [Denticeps clupeoides]XP_028831805.1 atypical chemokine receptor 4-like [Denticeps clupeoides]
MAAPASGHDYDYPDPDNGSLNYSYEDGSGVCEKSDVRSFAGIFLPAVYSACLAVGLAGNGLVVAVYARHKRPRTMTDTFVVHLAVADLLLLMTLPLWAAGAARGWHLGQVLCKAVSCLYTVNFSCGMLLLACISVDRYLAATPASRTRGLGSVFKSGHSSKVCSACWAVAFLLGIPDLVFTTVISTHHDRKTCMAVFPHTMALVTRHSLEVVEVVLSFLLPGLLMIFCYVRVLQAIDRLPQGRRDRKWRATRILLVVVGVFVLTQLPYNIVKLCRSVDAVYALVTHCDTSKALDRASQVTESLALTHCCLNPVLYALVGSSFRLHVLRFAKSFGQWSRRKMRMRMRNVTADSEEQVEPGAEISHTGSRETSTFSI